MKLEEIYNYWKNPYDGHNTLEDYMEKEITIRRSKLILNIFNKFGIDKDKSILELGCNIGRNLNFLYKNDYKNLTGIDIRKEAIDTLKIIYPEMGTNIELYVSPIENIIGDLSDYDIIFTLAVLEHIHTDSEWIFKKIYNLTKDKLILIEDEKKLSWRHYPRQYKDIFESYGMKQMYEYNCSEEDGLDNNFYVRVFEKVKI